MGWADWIKRCSDCLQAIYLKNPINLSGRDSFSFLRFSLFFHSHIYERQTDSYNTTLTSMKCFSRCEWERQRKDIPKNILCNTKRDKIEEWSKTIYLSLCSWATIYRCSLPILKCFHGLKTYYQGIFWMANKSGFSFSICFHSLL